MDEQRIEIDRLRAQAAALEPGQTRAALLEEAVRRAELSGDPYLALALRIDVLRAYQDAWMVDRAIAVFPLIQRQAEQNRGAVHPQYLVWLNLCVINMTICRFEIAAAQVRDLLEQAKDRLDRIGQGDLEYWFMRRRVAMNFGDWADADEAHRRIGGRRGSWWAGGMDYERYEEMRYHVLQGRHEEGLAVVAGDLANWPAMITAQLLGEGVLVSMVALGRWAEADNAHRRGWRYLHSPEGYRGHWGRHLWYHAATGNFAAGAAALEEFLPETLHHADHSNQFENFLTCRFFLERLAGAGRDEVRLRLPEELPPHRTDGRYPTGELADWFLGAADVLRKQADARHGNGYFAQLLEERHWWHTISKPLTAA